MRQHGTVQAGESTGQQQQQTGWLCLNARIWLIPVLFRSVPLPTPEKTTLAPTHSTPHSRSLPARTFLCSIFTTTQQQQAAALKKELTKY